MLVEYQPERPSMRAFSIGPITVLIRVWPVLKSLPLIGILSFRGQVAQRGDVDRQVRRTVGERHALEDRRVRVEHRRGDRRVVGVDGRFERFEVGMCAGPGSMKISVLAHHIITTRSTCFSSRKRLMSSRIALSIERLLIVCIVLSASMRFTYSRSNAAGIGRTRAAHR